MRNLLLLLLFFCSSCFVVAQESSGVFRYGKLKNGLTYYIRHTEVQSGYADYYLVQNVGSLLEDDNQNGLAHVLEHMAFHSTQSFPDGVPAFLQRHGVETFNAVTKYDETIYHIDHVPTASRVLVDSCVLVLRDWSGFLKLKSEDMDQERKVIREERRVRMNVSKRVKKMAEPYLYNGSKYAIHDIIGTVDVVQNFTPEQLRSYYNDFYRPDQQAVMIIGDIDVEQVETTVKRLFDPIPKRKNPKPRLVYKIENNDRPLYAKLIDKEISNNSIQLVKRIPWVSVNSLEDMLREMLLRDFYNSVMRGLITEYVEAGESYLLSAGAWISNLVRNYDSFNMVLTSLPGKEKEALQQMLDKIEYVHRFGFTDEVLQPLIEKYRQGVRANMGQEGSMPNSVFLQIYQDNFLLGRPLCTVDEKLDVTLSVLDTLSAKNFQDWISDWYGGSDNWVFLMQGNDSTYLFPNAQEIEKMIQDSRSADMEQLAAREEVIEENAELIDFEIKPGRIVKEKTIKMLDAEEWVLDNGARIFYKYTDGDKGMFNMLAGSPGGRSVIKAEDLPSADALSALFLQGGLYKYDMNALGFLLKDHTVDMNLSLDERSESISVVGASVDLEIAFQLFYLAMERPRFDSVLFNRFVAVNRMNQANSNATINDTISEMLSSIRRVESPRLWKKDTDYYSAMNFDRMIQIYKERFQDASDFTFYLVGDIEREKARELVAKYVGAIPSAYRKETPVEHHYDREGNITEDIEVNMPDRKYLVSIEFVNNLKTTPMEEVCMRILKMYFQYRFQEEIRGERGAAYSVQVLGEVSSKPRYQKELFIRFATSLDEGPRMRELVHEQIQEFLKQGMTNEDVEDFVLSIEKEKKSVDEMAYNTIAFWTENLQFYNKTGKRMDSPIYFDAVIDKIKARNVLGFARRFFNTAQCVDLVIKSKY